ncbi:hypothetical protein BDA99DRAFT_324123 [Phascolomyces articulosus]|uniref:Uncharacterized protein n=1 Tax=Phascolomyces articulosus TaxID=60185 RepID=A0AAD5KFQ5_9FUNG|nr:hypothetical protein BDA99DRAFT_324123 [Phascolomyces articulosus]
MAKETAPPKAVNIVRPSHSFMPQKPASRISTSSSSVASFVSAPPTTYLYQQQHSHSQSNQYQRHPTTSTSKAPRVASTTRVHDTVNHSNKPALNIYHPPSPPQPQPQQQRSKTFSLIDTSHNNNNHRRSIVTSSSSSSSLSNTHHHHHHQPHANHSTAILSPPSPPPQQYTSSSTVSSFSSSMTGSSSSSASHYQQQQSHRPNFEIYKPPSRAKTLAVPPAGLVSQQHSPRRPASHHSTVRNLVVGPISKPHEEPITNVANNNHIIHDESPDELSDQDDESDTIRDSEDDNDQGLENVDDEEEEEEEDEEVNEARVNRKIADLEISNRSLLAVNSMLEATVRKQASEVAKMKSQIR